mgnify:CR=1 FL=1
MRLFVLLWTALAALSGCVKDSRDMAKAVREPATHYPRLAFYGRLATNGAPILRGGVIVPSAVDSAARFDVVVLDAPVLMLAPKIAAALKDSNPRMTLLALVNSGLAWNNPRPPMGDSLTELNACRYRLARESGAILRSRTGREWSPNLDLSNHVFAVKLAELDARALEDVNVDGLFCDWSTPTIAWTQTPRDSIDYRRAGWDSHRDWCRAYVEGHRLYAMTLRRLAGSKLLVGNGGPSGERDLWNGWMRENFPHQNGGDWYANMVQTPWGDHGYLADESLYVQPSLCFLSSIETGDSLADLRTLRLGLASASLTNGVHVMVKAPLLRDWWPRWFPDYDADFGAPDGPAEPNGDTWSRRFAKGYVLVDTRTKTGTLEKAR